ncbi:MAG: hypothetical protein AAGD06_14995 [Acidobacteriota bacterium]
MRQVDRPSLFLESDSTGGLPKVLPRLAAAVLLALGLGLSAAPAAAQDAAAARLFQEAARKAEAGDFGAALDEYRLLVRQFPRDTLAPRALLGIVDLYRATGDERGARGALDTLLTDYARTIEAASGFLVQGEMAVSAASGPADLQEARAEFRRVPLLFGTTAYPDLEARARARVRSAEVGLLLGDPEGAKAELVAAVEDEPPSPWTGRARLLLGRTLLDSGDWVAGLEILQRLADSGALDPDSAESTSPIVTETDRAQARHLLSLAHRHRLRPAAGQKRWTDTERFPQGVALRSPSGVAASLENGQVLVVDDRQGLVVLAPSGGGPAQTRQLEDPVRPGFYRDVPYVVTDDKILLPFDGQRLSFLEPRTGKPRDLDDLRAAVRGPFGDWFLLAKGWKSLLHFTGPRTGQELLGTLRPDPVDLTSDPLGRVVLLDARNDRVIRMGLGRRAQQTLVQGDWRRPQALAIDGLGQIYVLDRGEKQVFVYGPEGRPITTVGPQLGGGIVLSAPVDIAVGSSGRLYIADSKLPFVAVLD